MFNVCLSAVRVCIFGRWESGVGHTWKYCQTTHFFLAEMVLWWTGNTLSTTSNYNFTSHSTSLSLSLSLPLIRSSCLSINLLDYVSVFLSLWFLSPSLPVPLSLSLSPCFLNLSPLSACLKNPSASIRIEPAVTPLNGCKRFIET